ncbi:hypothetical protein NECAME_15175 [Necator americanus]|uniref:Uncharacterized protein n=1 Tax=Necator americanus TaxID=51031 RepID=W2SJC2_NECAM|nr:hypothetical protein NECAME_15175 [Necator americanus]ETN69663.1 hypothetical protein NECAME_15175 [Necator americanus]
MELCGRKRNRLHGSPRLKSRRLRGFVCGTQFDAGPLCPSLCLSHELKHVYHSDAGHVCCMNTNSKGRQS